MEPVTTAALAAGIPVSILITALVTVAVMRERQSNTAKVVDALGEKIDEVDDKLDQFVNHPYHDFKQEVRKCLADMRVDIEVLKLK